MFHSGFYLFGYLKQRRSMEQRNLQVDIFGLCFFHLYLQCLRIGHFCTGHFHGIRNPRDLRQVCTIDLKAIGCLIPGDILLLDRKPLWKLQLHRKTLLFYCQCRGSFLLHRIDLELEAICPRLIRLFHGCHRQVIFRHFPDDMKNPGFNTDSHPPHLSPHPFWCYHCYYWMSLWMALLWMASLWMALSMVLLWMVSLWMTTLQMASL